MAFWTALLIRRMATNSVAPIWPSWRFPDIRNKSKTARYTTNARMINSRAGSSGVHNRIVSKSLPEARCQGKKLDSYTA
jgi:hypothetical protein